MQRHKFMFVLSALTLTACLTTQVQAQAASKIAVTDLAYTQSVSEYFEAAVVKHNSQMQASRHMTTGNNSVTGTYVGGQYNYIEQRELGSFTNDIKGALLKGTAFKLIQGGSFDKGAPQNTKAEQALNQVQTGKMAKPVRQPEVKDIIARIKKGEFKGADFVLFGTLSHIDFRDQFSPLQGTTSATIQYGLDLLADFSLINTKTYEIKASFSAQGNGNDTKMVSNRGDIVPPNRVKVMRETSQSLAQNVYEQLMAQLGNEAGAPAAQGQAEKSQQQPDQVIILK